MSLALLGVERGNIDKFVRVDTLLHVSDIDFPYDNRTGRGPGRVVRAMGLVLPGVRRVRDQAEPYADAWHAHNRAALRRPGRRWIVLGDSMSQGVGAPTFDGGWVGQLAGRLSSTSDDLVVVNLSATGARVTDVLEQQLPAMALIGSREDDVVSVLAGSNDLFSGAEAREALPKACATLLERLPQGSVVSTLPPRGPAGAAANRHIEAARAAGQVRVVDMMSDGPASWRGKLAADFFHPNQRGYAAIADAFEAPMRAALVRGLEAGS